MKRIAIVQSNYIPWKGYFDLIRASDEFVLYDSVQFTRRDWRNRNQIKTASGPAWLTVPVETRGRYLQRIDETRIAGSAWAGEHWQRIRHAYARAPHFAAYADELSALYAALADEPLLGRVNRRLLEAACGWLGIGTPLTACTGYPAEGDATQRLVGICVAAGATHYLSGPAARAYLRPELFSEAGIVLEYADYSGYPEYPQPHGAFVHGVSVLDLLFNVGPDAPRYLIPVV